MSELEKTNKEVISSTEVNDAAVDSSAFDKNAGDSVEDTGGITIAPDTDKPVDFADFQRVIDGTGAETIVETKTGKTQDITAPVEVKSKTEQTSVVKPTQQTQQPVHTGSRDYSDFDDTEKEVLKKMSNQAFAYVAPKLKELRSIGKMIAEKDTTIAQLKTGKQMLPDSYFEHPQAYVLTKEFADNARDLNTASTVQSHWRQQLANIRKGEPWYDLDINGQGQLVKSAQKVSDADAEAQVMENLHFAVNQTSGLQAKGNAIEEGFKERHTKAIGVLDKAYKDNFAAYEDAKHPMRPMMDNILSQIPQEFRSNPLAKMTAAAATAALQFGEMYKAAKAELDELKKVGGGTTKTDSRQSQAGPTKDSLTATGGSGKHESVVGTKIEDFMKAMEQ